ncbi:unnamed protein product [Leptosia nina]|uniref:Uncharacterized protein n=1 Tax=Leptosia nina TaxID=320188 RepID=A0AAV1IWZ4_9NEOP
MRLQARCTVTEMVILLTGSKITTRQTKRRIMHHLGNFSIRRVVRVGPTRAPPRGEPVAPLSIIRTSLSLVARRPARGRAGGARHVITGHLGLGASTGLYH